MTINISGAVVLSSALLIFTASLILLLVKIDIVGRNAHDRSKTSGAHLLIVLGSGGHTAEMLSMLSDLPISRYTYRTYLVGRGDTFSIAKAKDFENSLIRSSGRNEEIPNHEKAVPLPQQDWCIRVVPRARQIHQSLWTTPMSCLCCFWTCVRILYASPQGLPDLILMNGPATSLILALAAIFIQYVTSLFRILSTLCTNYTDEAHKPQRSTGPTRRIQRIYVESWARVKSPSLSLRIIRHARICDRVLVQHEALAKAGWGEYRGVFVR